MPGKKISNLRKLKENGIRVPDFCVVDYEKIVEVKKLPEICFREDLEIVFPKDSTLEGGCEEQPAGCGGEPRYAVRSACSVEDGAEQSFAGQFDTYLNVRREDCREKVRACVQSLSAEHVQVYVSQEQAGERADNCVKGRADQGGRRLRMDVMVQCMVDAELSGVMFTANPQGILNESVITVGRGLGEGVVSDRVATTTYYYNLTDRLYYYEGEEDLLSPELVEELTGTAEEIKKILNEEDAGEESGGIGEYDIEFAVRGGKIFILQARPITTLRTDAPLILDNSNIVESYPGLSLPLTISFVNIVYGGVFRGVSARVLKNDRELNKHADVFQNMVGHANGRVYYKISNWYTVLKFLPFHKKIIPVWQEMLGVRNKSYDGEEVELSLPVRFMTYVNSLYEMLRVPRNMKKLNEDFQKIRDEFYADYAQYDQDREKDPARLLAMYQEIKAKLFDVWDVTLLNDLYAFVFTGLLKNRLKKKYGKAEQDVNRYISDISDIESMKPIRALVELAYRKDELSRREPAGEKTDRTTGLNTPEKQQTEYERQKAEYIQIYGDRNLEELKLESKTFRSNPELLEERIETYRKDPARLKEIYEELCAGKAYGGAETDIIQRGGKEKADTSTRESRDLILRFYEKQAALGIANREISRLNRSRIYGIVRLIFTTIGKQFAVQGILEKQEDIFYLTVEEVFALVESKENLAESIESGDRGRVEDVKRTVAERKEQYQLFAQLPAYSRLIFAGREFDKQHSRVNAYRRAQLKQYLQGVPCSGGEVTAEALVIENVNQAQDVAGKILITRMTDPGWVFLLATAKGVISEKGSLLSHTAIISRELKIPSIVGVSNLLETVHTGDVIHMDGSTGRIRINIK
ncbi:MAG: phosphoenolpyruvate synthase [Lachnospiraceae bacterium]|nr:phosphoenolpyruvate synthase [Lachnospiraceae bacterium]